ncbi:ABC transporter permease [Achromobacter marplatensis]|jgi:peptide/nickel transport system permease protein|uniref:Peptide/nickel transport system permease protein n=1 Tax=Achromobacter marplatensis TaxID=470868 RepID=A0ABX9GJJ9_9BURK|nr:ABC transporter permease [Achromobacter marplatensis]EJO30579.1 binding-protein-dependent transporter inner membrane component family protein 26 [Achromobacter marplatensis]OWT60515.1 ABC transporter permease [Achromobacter marplatensis]RBP23229.1 peptide/nickel transport system permease protein [Achromobacter marplatensis]CAB3710399.1 Dipeptide transport system permease protein DppB [Achromobacter marplatensis]
MLAFIVRRVFNAVGVMLAVALLAFVIFRFVGDPVDMMLNEQASQTQRDELRERLGLNASVGMQFVHFVTNAAQGEFGISYRNQQDVFALVAERFPATFELVMMATLLSLVIGVPLGVLTAIYRKSRVAQALQFVSILGISLPSFVVGIMLILIFSVQLGWLPGFGRGDTVKIGWWSTGLLTPSGRAALVLPSITLALFQITLIMRLVRAEMLETLRTEFIKFARARGLPDRVVHFRLALRNCLMPVITVTGMQIGNLIAFALITETVFQWPGMGLLFIQSVMFVDIPVMAAYLVIVSFIFVALNTLVDMMYGVVDPRLRSQHVKGGANAH